MGPDANMTALPSPGPVARRPRIWRLPGLSSWQDECLAADGAATDERLAAIRAAGFTGIWFFVKMRDVMASRVFPELNAPAAEREARIASLQAAIERARAHDLDVWLYFNDPGGLEQDHPFWQEHPELRGEPQWDKYGFCTSTAAVRDYCRDGWDSILGRLPGLAGVILITACEDITHCWSKRAVRQGSPPPSCPRCAEREPAAVIGELLRIWDEIRQAHGIRVIAWNWEWAYYYDDPPTPIVEALPPGLELMADLEIGGDQMIDDQLVPITEYSYSYVGPGRRFYALAELAAARGIPFHAKIQINNTHELCSVPNLPLIHALHAKHTALYEAGVDSYMGSWTIGLELTLNTAAVQLFWSAPERFADWLTFATELARTYFGYDVDVARVAGAWERFSAAFAQYPFDIPLLYYGPHNDGLARAMSLDYRGQPVGRSYMGDEPGDDLSRCLERYSAVEAARLYERMAAGWRLALLAYEQGLRELDGERCRQELGVARTIGALLASAGRHYAFHHRRAMLLAARGLTPPCTLPRDAELLALMQAELQDCRAILSTVATDPRLGYHEEFQGYKFSPALIRAKVNQLKEDLGDMPATAK